MKFESLADLLTWKYKNYNNLRRDSNVGGKEEAEFYRKGEIEPSRQLINNLNNQRIEFANEIGIKKANCNVCKQINKKKWQS